MHRRERWDCSTFVAWASFFMFGMLVGNWLPSNINPNGGSIFYLPGGGGSSSGSLFNYSPSGGASPSTAHDDAVYAEMLVHPGMLAGDPQGVVGVILSDAPSSVVCEVLKYMSVKEVLLFPAPTKVLSVSGFSKAWACSSDPRVKEVQWESQAASNCKSIDTIIVDGAQAGAAIPATTAAVVDTAVWIKILCLLDDDGNFIFPVCVSTCRKVMCIARHTI